MTLTPEELAEMRADVVRARRIRDGEALNRHQPPLTFEPFDFESRHLPGKHDQLSHGRKGPKALAKAAAAKAAAAALDAAKPAAPKKATKTAPKAPKSRNRPITRRELEKVKAKRELSILRVRRRNTKTPDRDLDSAIARAEDRLHQDPSSTNYNWSAPHWDEPAGVRMRDTPGPDEVRAHVESAVSTAIREPLRSDLVDELTRQAEMLPVGVLNLWSVADPSMFSHDSKTSLAYYDRNFRQVVFNPAKWAQTDGARAERRENLRRGLSSGWWSHTDANSPGRSVLAHEFGHHVADQAIENSDYTQIVKLARAFDEGMGANGTMLKRVRLGVDFRTAVDQWLSDNRWRLGRDNVSQYGLTDHQELMAEVWHEFTTSDNPRPHVAAMGLAMLDAARKEDIVHS